MLGPVRLTSGPRLFRNSIRLISCVTPVFEHLSRGHSVCSGSMEPKHVSASFTRGHGDGVSLRWWQ